MTIREGLNEIRLRLISPMNLFWKRFQKVCAAVLVAIPTSGVLDAYFDIFPKTATFQLIKAFLLGLMIMGVLIPALTTKEPIKLSEAKKDENAIEDNLTK